MHCAGCEAAATMVRINCHIELLNCEILKLVEDHFEMG